MRRVYALYLVRQIARPAVRLTVLACAFFGIAVSVSLSSVFQNLINAGDALGFFRLILDAFIKTDFLVHRSAARVAVSVGWFVVDRVRNNRGNSSRLQRIYNEYL